MKQIEASWPRVNRAVITDDTGNGCVFVEIVKKSEGSRFRIGEALIWNLAVNEGHRKSGIGHDLLMAAEDYLREKHVTSVYLDWSPDEAPDWVLRWYKRQGYQIVNVCMEENYYTLRKRL